MRFVVLYRNREDIKKLMAEQLVDLIKQGIKLNETHVRSPMFATQPFWPKWEDLEKLPMFVQCEEVEWDGSKLILKRQLVIDLEVLSVTSILTPE